MSPLPPPLSETIAAPTSEQTNMQIAFAAVLAARRETFLARYPRNLKLFVTFLLICMLVSPAFFVEHESKLATMDKGAHKQDVAEVDPAAMQLLEAPPRPAPLAEGETVHFKNEAEQQAATKNDGNDGSPVALDVAPDMALVEETPSGPLPKISADGRTPWQVYGRPFMFQDPRPRIALVVVDLGTSRVATDAALRRLPPAVTLAFDTQAQSVGDWLVRARQDGHETILSIPMEPSDYPRSDPGPDALLTALPNADNMQRLLKALRLGTGYVGITTIAGSRFLSDATKLQPVMEVLQKRGLLFLDTRVTSRSTALSLAQQMKIPAAAIAREIDVEPTPAAIDESLTQLERSARLEGTVIALASPLPVTLERIELWAKTLPQRGIVLTPLSAALK